MRSHISVRISKGDGGPPRPPVRCGKPERIKPHTAPAKADGAAALGLGARALPEHDLFPILIPKAETGLAERQSRRRFFGPCTVYVHIMYTLCTMLLLEKLIKHTYTHASVLNQAAATELSSYPTIIACDTICMLFIAQTCKRTVTSVCVTSGGCNMPRKRY